MLAITHPVTGLRRSLLACSQPTFLNNGHACFCCLLLVWSQQLLGSWWNHYIWEVGAADSWPTLRTPTTKAENSQQKGSTPPQWHPSTCHTTNTLNTGHAGSEICLTHRIYLTTHQQKATFSSILTSCQESASLTDKMCFQVFIKFWSLDFFLGALFVMSPIYINKVVLEYEYHDLQFTVPNSIPLCFNLIEKELKCWELCLGRILEDFVGIFDHAV